MTWSIVLAALASVAAGAALLELARLPLRRGLDGRTAGSAGEADPAGVGVAAVLSLSGGSSTGARGTGRSRRGPAPAPGRTRWAAATGADRRTERMLDAAGRTGVPDAATLAARQRLGGLLGGAWGGAVALMVVPPPIAVALAAGGLAGGRLLPVVLLRRAGAQRALQLRDESPELLDLLAVALGCGLPIRAALEMAGRWSVGELSDGVSRAAAELGRGSGIGPTLARLHREHPGTELEAAISILERSRQHGTAASGPLRALAASARHARARRAMEHAARAAPRIQLVAALLLVPAALCVLAASLVAGGIG